MGGRPKGTGGKAKELSPLEIERVIKCLSGTTHQARNQLLFVLGLGSGLRISELCGLTLADVAPHRKALSEIVLEKHSTKSKTSRTVHITRQAQNALSAHLRTREGEPLSSPLFPSGKNPRKGISPNSAVTVLKTMFTNAGISGASSHSLRRTHANALRRQGADLKIIQQQLGHSSLAITERYFDVDPIEIRAAVGKLRF